MRAKAICRQCPVLTECRVWALTKVGSDDRHTILGGMTWSQRKVWLRKYRPRELDKAEDDDLPVLVVVA
jgi:hypothetical protein